MNVTKLKYHLFQNVIHYLNRFKKPKINTAISGPDDLYNKIYIDVINTQIKSNFGDKNPLKIIDGGCGTGTIGIELAKAGHDVKGIDYHQPSLDIANINFKKKNAHMHLIRGELFDTLLGFEDNSYDVGICLEVLYTCVNYKEIIRQFARVIKTNGIFIASFPSKFYFITTLLAQKQYSKALYAAEKSEGLIRIGRIPVYYNWQTIGDIESLFCDNDLKLLNIKAIGIFSGTGYDGMSKVANLVNIPKDVISKEIYKLETSEIEDYRGVGRYILAVGKKKNVNVDHISE